MRRASGRTAAGTWSAAAGSAAPRRRVANLLRVSAGARCDALQRLALSLFAQGISSRVGRQVVDRTGLTGEWSFELKYSLPPAPGADPAPPDPNAPDLFTAVREQLGLKFEATRGPVEVWVVDSIERPVAD